MDKYNILIISSDNNIIDYLTQSLKHSYTFSVVKDYKEAIDYFVVDRTCSLIIFDILNVNDYLNFRSVVSSNNSFNNIPVLCFVNNKEDEIVCFNNFANEVIYKPINNEVTEFKINKMIDFYIVSLSSREKRFIKSQVEAETRLYTLVNNIDSAYAYIELDVNKWVGKILHCNDAYYDVFKLDKNNRKKYTKIYFDEVSSEDDRVKFLILMKGIINNGGSFTDSFMFKTTNGEKIWVKLKCVFNNEYSNGKPCIYTIFDDISEVEMVKENNRKIQEELSLKYSYDELTNIYNRTKFEEKTELLLSINPDISYYIITFNISKFKLINETLGVEIGDQVLIGFSKSMSEFLNHIGCYGRLRDDDFVLCMPKSAFDEEKFSVFLDSAFDDLHINYRVIAYAGIYEVVDRSLSVSQMIDRATLVLESDEINYLKRYAFYNDSLREQLLDEQEIEKNMDNAILNKEFEIYLQPIYSLSMNNVCKAEVLVRWHHPEKGMISPGKFIPVFENNGFIIKLDHYVWEEACKYIRSRIDRGRRIIPLSINISRKDLYYEDTIDFISSLITKYQLKPEYLDLEITESAYSDNPNLIIDSVNEFKKRGFKVLMDDFGSGYSSFNTLKDLNVDVIKLDMKFLEDFESSSKTSAIITSIVRMAKWLNMDIIAEGVETTEEMNFLRSLGCDKIQGYLLSKPVCIKDFEDQNRKNLDGFDNTYYFNENDYVELFESFSDNLRFDISMGGIGILEYNPNKKVFVHRLNRLGYKIFDLPYGSISYKKLDLISIIDSSYRKEFLSYCEKAIYSTEAIKCELKCVNSKGEDIYLDVYLRGLGKEKVSQYLCINFIDITDKRKAQYDLNNAYNYLKKYVNVGLFKIKIEDGNYELFEPNDVLVKLLGYHTKAQVSAMFEKKPFMHILEKDLESVKKYINLAISNNKAYNYNIAFLNTKNCLRRCTTIVYKLSSENNSHIVQFIVNPIGTNKEDYSDIFPVFSSIITEIYEVNTKKNTFNCLLNNYIEGVLNSGDNYKENMKQVMHSVIHADYKHIFYNNLMRMFDKNDIFDSFEFIFKAKVNDQFHYISDIVIRKDEEICYVITRDINEIAKEVINNEVEQSKDDLLALSKAQTEILEKEGQIIIEYDYKTDYLYKSKGLNDYNINDLGFNQMKLFKYYQNYIHPEDFEILNNFNQKLLVGNYAFMLIRLANTIGDVTIYTFCEVTAIRITDENNEPIKIVTTIKNVNDEVKDKIESERKKLMYNSFADSYERVAHNLPVSISIVEVLNNKLYPRYVTNSMCQLLGFDFEEIEYKCKNNIPSPSIIIDKLNINLPTYINDEYEFDSPVSFVNLKGKRIWTRIVGRVKAVVDGYKYYFCAIDHMRDVNLDENERINRLFEVFSNDSKNVIFNYNIKEDAYSYYVINSNHKVINEATINHFLNYISVSSIISNEFKKEYLDIFSTKKITNKKYSGVFEYLALQNGHYEWNRVMYNYSHDELGNVLSVYGEIVNVHEQDVRRREFIDIIETDHLSGLTNRIAAEGKISTLLNKNNKLNKNYAFIMIDIDCFKTLNDKYGHPMGDKVIEKVSENLIKVFGQSEAILSRFGGDEFVCFIEYSDIKEVTSSLDTLLFNINHCKDELGFDNNISLSIGISLNNKAKDFNTMYDNADKALYVAKEKKNSYSFFEGDNK